MKKEKSKKEELFELEDQLDIPHSLRYYKSEDTLFKPLIEYINEDLGGNIDNEKAKKIVDFVLSVYADCRICKTKETLKKILEDE